MTHCRTALISAIVVVLLAVVGVVTAAPDCTHTSCVYVPVVGIPPTPAPTDTPAPTNTPCMYPTHKPGTPYPTREPRDC